MRMYIDRDGDDDGDVDCADVDFFLEASGLTMLSVMGGCARTKERHQIGTTGGHSTKVSIKVDIKFTQSLEAPKPE